MLDLYFYDFNYEFSCMNTALKKLLAREFLFLLGASIIISSSFAFWHLRSNYLSNKEVTLSLEISDLFKLLDPTEVFIAKVFFDDKTVELNQKIFDDYDHFITKIRDSTKAQLIFNKIKGNRTNFVMDSGKFAAVVIADYDSNNFFEEIIFRRFEILDVRDSFFYDYFYNSDVYYFSFGVFMVIFLFRYIWYATRWSIRQLR